MGGKGSGKYQRLYMKPYTIDGLGQLTLREIMKLVDRGLVRFTLDDKLKEVRDQYIALKVKKEDKKIVILGIKKVMEIE